ncbi:MAG TPA: Na+/H+ antiporter NhaA [Saprospiraceae bacterium]|nr:Na+/H+ antiporter NhaA [Saprospiraceae bacterium]
MRITKLFQEFFQSENAGGLVLIACTFLSLLLANSHLGEAYASIWALPVGSHELAHWINDGLMAIFFLLIGLELKREMIRGELSTRGKATLPVIAAIGGMVVPALLYTLFNYGTELQSGAGIPMATDIAFAIGVMSILGDRVPLSLKILLTALAVIDDLGAILIIALFYTDDLSMVNLAVSGGIYALLLFMNRLQVKPLLPYLLGGTVMWYFMLHSGVHATITGVLLAYAIPFGDGSQHSASYKLQHLLHKPVAFFIVPVFALANTCIFIDRDWTHGLMESNSLGILAGLFIGKPVGIFLFIWLAVVLKLSPMPERANWMQILGVGCLAGIGFTMSIFITLLAFDQIHAVTTSKISILIASLFSGLLGYALLQMASVKAKQA